MRFIVKIFILLAAVAVASAASARRKQRLNGRQLLPTPDTPPTAEPGEQRCINKLMLVDEIQYEDRIKCHHTYKKNCFETIITTYKSVEQEECANEYQKSCYIQYNKVARETDVEVCNEKLERNCDLPGEIVCSIEAETVCETLHKDYEVIQDEPECQTVVKQECMDPADPSSCRDIPRQECQVNTQKTTKRKPETKCRREEQRVCGPSSCPLTKAEPICKTERKTVLEDEPEEACDLVPQRTCKMVAKLLPQLIPKRKCVEEPREVCIRMRVNPRRVRRPVVKEWCTTELDHPHFQEQI